MPALQVRIAMHGGEPVDASVVRLMQEELNMPAQAIWNGYGQAEVGLYITAGGISLRGHLASCGMPPILRDSRGELLPVQPVVRIASMEDDEDRETTGHAMPASDGTVGHVWVRTPIVANGYYGNPDKTAETFHNCLEGEEGEWLETGDLGMFEDGVFYVTGRSKDVIIIYGDNYYPVDLERALDAAYEGVLRPGSTACFQKDKASVGVVAEVPKTASAEEVPTAASIRSTVQRASGANVRPPF